MGYLGPKKTKNKKILWTSDQPVTTSRQGRCDTITGRRSCLVPSTKASKIENIEDIFHLFFDENMINKIVDHTNNGINETITRLQRVESYIKSIF